MPKRPRVIFPAPRRGADAPAAISGCMGRKSVGSRQVEVFVVRFSDHTREGVSDSPDAKMKIMFVQEKMFVRQVGGEE